MVQINYIKTILWFLRKKRWLVLLTTLIVICGAYFLYLHLEKMELDLYELHLENILKIRQKSVRDFLDVNKEGVVQLSIDKDTMEFAAKNKNTRQKQEANDEDISQKTALYQKVQNTVASFQRQYQFTKVIIMSPEGEVLFALNNGGKWQDYLNNGVMKKTVMKSLERVRATLSLDISEIAFNSESQSSFMIMSSPMVSEGKVVGIICVQLNHMELFDKINNFSDLGDSGEVILTKSVEPGAIIVAPTRKSKNDSFKSYLTLKDKHKAPLIYASQGQRGSEITLDYAGDKAFASWDFIPQLNLGVTVIESISELSTLIPYRIIVVRLLIITICLIFLWLTLLGFILCAQNNTNGHITWNKKVTLCASF